MAINSNQPEKSASRPSQSTVFLESEGDGWFERNKAAVNGKSSFYETDVIKRVLQNFQADINHILEIGCSNGTNLNDLCAFFKAKGSGVDPSPAAVKDGRDKYKQLDLSVGTAAKLPFNDDAFDLVYFGFCLYLVGREEVFRAVSEADRVLKNGGFLVILDFDPKQRHQRPYHHKPGLLSFKTSYSDFFTAGGHYYLIAKESLSHSDTHFTTDSDERVSICILYKEPEAYSS
ncbi:MAG: class I SAM-dependent methyltransferase [Candidatus Margulisiibacteriota bacterium]